MNRLNRVLTATLLSLLCGTALATGPLEASSDAQTDVQMEGHAGHSGHQHTRSLKHQHRQGEWMVAYRYMHMSMDGNRSGTSDTPTAAVLGSFLVSPLRMDMDMHMLGAMYGYSDRLTLMAMLPHIRNSMDHITRTGKTFTTRSEGIGDARLSGRYLLSSRGKRQWAALFGVSLPTGATDKRDVTPLGRVVLPYSMQLGSGTWDLLPGLDYQDTSGLYAWGAEASAVLRLGSNDGYSLGNRWGLSGWVSRQMTRATLFSVQLNAETWGDIDGANPLITQTTPTGVPIVPTADPDLRAGTRLDLVLGLDLTPVSGVFAGYTFKARVGRPVYQHLDGPQLETDWIAEAGIEMFF